MNVKALKACILSNTIPKFLIFAQDETALAKQYLSNISSTLNKSIKYFDSIESLIYSLQTNIIRDNINIVLNDDKFYKNASYIDALINSNEYIYLLFDNFNKKDEINKTYDDYIVRFNKVDKLTILAYVQKQLNSHKITINQDKIIEFIEYCNNDLSIVLNELDKILILAQDNSNILTSFILNNNFTDYRNMNIFIYINKILNKDKSALLDTIKISDSPVVILYNLYNKAREKFIDTKIKYYKTVMELSCKLYEEIIDGSISDIYVLNYLLLQLFND